MGLNWRDVGQAISDLQLQIMVILGTLIILLCFTIIFGVISSWLNRSTERKPQRRNPKSIVGLRLRMRHGAWQPAPSPEQPSGWWSNYWQGISTEFFGAVVTTIFLGLGVLIFDQYQDIQNRKAELILQMGSPDNVTAVEALRQMSVEGWLRDGTLRGAVLGDANLQGVYLVEDDLQGAILFGANLKNTLLLAVNLQGADLQNANLQQAYLGDANLIGANLVGANLVGAILPDRSEWASDTDMTRFTDPSHPDFWDPCREAEIPPRFCL